MIALDTETTGINLPHGCAPFFVTMCERNQDPTYMEWFVDPITRQPEYDQRDLRELKRILKTTDRLVCHNAKFDIKALSTCIAFDEDALWNKTDCTLTLSHIISSSSQHDLTSLGIKYVGVDITVYEERLAKAVKEARDYVLKKLPDWNIIRKNRIPSTTPSAKSPPKEGDGTEGKAWKFDMWLPRTLARHLNLPPEHHWWHALRAYSCADSALTIVLRDRLLEEIRDERLLRVYGFRMEAVKVSYKMERHGVTYSTQRANSLLKRYEEESVEAEKTCLSLSDGKMSSLPKGGTSKALDSLIFDHYKLPVVLTTKKGKRSCKSAAIEQWLSELPQDSKPHRFLKNLRDKRKRDTACTFLRGYERVSLPVIPKNLDKTKSVDDLVNKLLLQDIRRMYYNLNMTGSGTLRGTSSDPNSQNISKKEGFNLRYAFCPALGREWWSMDYENIELRLPAYESGEEEMIYLFEHPDEPPYYGSQHLLISHLLFPKEFEKCLKEGTQFKKVYASTLYQRVKNGDFAVQYGAIEREEGGTADKAYGMVGAHKKVKSKFKKLEKLNQSCIQFAQEHGFVYTMTDKEFGIGYPLDCPFYRGRVKPTIPLNYRVQGTAMWCMNRAMVRCQAYLDTVNAEIPSYHDWYYITMQIHDELVFDFPAGNPRNQEVADNLKNCMECSGDYVDVPLKVSVSYHPDNFSESVTL